MSELITSKSIRYNLERFRMKFSSKTLDINDTLAIFGTPRSGTTWMMEILSDLPGYISLFEPLHPSYPLPREYDKGFNSRPYIHPNLEDRDLNIFLENVFQGKLISETNRFKLKDSFKRFLADRLLVKFIRGNRLLPYIVDNFDLKGTVLIIRHPCATIASQYSTGITGYVSKHGTTQAFEDIDITREMVLTDLKNIVPDSIYKSVKRMDHRVSFYAVAWALDHYIPLFFCGHDDCKIVTYEMLVKDGKDEMDKILKSIGFNNTSKSMNKILSNTSMTTKGDYYKQDKEKQLSKWKNILSRKEQEKIFQVLDLFGIDFYDESIYPDLKSLKRWKGSWEPLEDK